MSAKSKPPITKTKGKDKNSKPTVKKVLPGKSEPDQKDNVKANILAALQNCWDTKKVKGLKIFERKPNNFQIPAENEESYKYILECAMIIKDLLQHEENDQTNGDRDTSDLSQKLETLTKEKDVLQKGLLEINNRWKQLWHWFCGAMRNSPKENPDARDIAKMLPEEIDNLQKQLRDEKEKSAQDIQQAKEELDKLNKEIEALKMAAPHESEENQEFIKVNDNQTNENNQMKAGVLSPTQLCVQLADEVEKHKDELVAAEEKSASSHEKEDGMVKGELEHERQMKEYEEKIKELETKLGDKSREIEKYKIKIEKLQEDLKEQPSRLQLAEKAQAGLSEQDVSGPNKEIQRLSKELEEVKSRLEEEEKNNKNGLNDHKQALEKRNKEYEKLSEEKKKIEQENLDLNKILQQKTEEWKSAQSKIKDLENQIKEQDEMLEVKSRESTEYENKMKKLQELQEQASSLQLAEKAQTSSSEQEDVNGSNKEIQRLSKELEKMQNLLEGEKDSKNIFKNKEEKYKSDLNEQKQTIEKLEKQQGQLSAEKKSIEKEKHDLTRELKQRTDKWKSAENGIKNLENEVKRLEEHIKVQKAGDEMKFLREQVKSLTDRLATEMNSKISADESALENISIGNRPMKLADDYHHFCSDIWLDAKQFLDDQSMEQEYAIVLLKDILMISERECVEAAKNVNVILMQLLTEPVKKTFAVAKEKEIAPAIPETVRAVFNGVGDYLRKTADKVNLMAICEVVPKKVPKKSSVLNSKEMEKYIAESVRLSWKMVIQRPAMTFSTEGEGKKWEGEQTQELYWGSKPDNKKAVVKYYIHPKLKHGDKLMVKGRVLVE